MFRRVPIFTIRVVYKSGYTHDFEVTEFKINQTENGKKMSWVSVSDSNKPVDIASDLDHIESVWQVGFHHVWKWGSK
jgi:hypothetical protein